MKNLLLFVCCFLISGAAFGQTTLLTVDFETNLNNYSHTPSQTPSDDPGDQYFHRAEPSDNNIYESSSHLYTNVTGNWLFVGSNPNTINGGNEGYLTLSGVNVNGYTDLEFSADFGAVPNDWDATDDLRVEYNFDGGSWNTLFSFGHSNGTNDPLTLLNNTIGGNNTANGTVLTFALQTITSDNFTGSGSTLNIRIACDAGANYEAFGVDNIILTGVAANATPEANFALTSTSQVEGNTGTTTHQVTVNMVPAPTNQVVLNLNIDGVSTATDITDFTVPSTVIFDNGDASQTFDITINGDTDIESDETVILNLTLNSGTANIGSSDQYTLTITNDDFPACIEPTAQPTVLNLTPSASSIDGSFTAATADGYLVVVSTSSTLSSTPTDATTYNAGDALGGGTVVSTSSSTTFTASSLTASTQYYFFVFAYNDQNCTDINYLTISPLTNNATTTAAPQVMITELADPSGTGGANARFIEITNRGNSDADVSNWTIDIYPNGNTNSNGTYTFPSSTTLTASGGGWVVAQSGSGFQSAYGFSANDTYGSFSSNGDDAYVLRNTGGVIIDVYGVVGTDGSGEAWEYTDAIAKRNLSVTSANTTWTSSEWTITSGDVNTADPLPVDLLHFTAKANNQTTILTWATATEENNAYFDIQRSTDGINFETIGQVEGAGTTYDVQEYSFIDESPVEGVNYYRLKQVDFDGQFEYHKIVMVNINGLEGDIAIVPTQVRNQFDVVITESINEPVEMNIISVNGQVVKSTIINMNGNRQTIEVSELNAGVYFVRLNVNNTIVTKRFVKL